MLKNVAQIVHTCHRGVSNFIVVLSEKVCKIFGQYPKLVCYLLNNGIKSVENVITFGDWGIKKHLLRGGVGAR